MAFFKIPLDNLFPAFSMYAELDKVSYQFRFRWNDRVGLWIFDLLDNEDNAIFLGKPFQTGVDLLRQASGPTVPKGTLVAINSLVSNVDADRFTIGGNVGLFYAEVEDA